MAAAADLDSSRTQELATTLGKAETQIAGMFTGEAGDAGLTLPGTKISDVSTTAIAKVAKAAQTLIADYDALSEATSTAVREFQNKDTENAGDIAAAQGALA
ncbi:hypothetical protein IU486_00895 [Streptomyces gardneri]|uniref:hypothetical protein n=1 Tax=Nocardia TaxID=1817 RepID=UPI0013597A20|nr:MULTISPECIES: hypothetical protein [Nocardia]MBF6163331.1 hypothetical protein [Streptomyces gardneri]MBF6202683.1 hypothetical protein [Streptomyces gardneri]